MNPENYNELVQKVDKLWTLWKYSFAINVILGLIVLYLASTGR